MTSVGHRQRVDYVIDRTMFRVMLLTMGVVGAFLGFVLALVVTAS